jgi:hypothetical protein
MKYLISLLLVLILSTSIFAIDRSKMPPIPTGGPHLAPPVIVMPPSYHHYRFGMPAPYYNYWAPRYNAPIWRPHTTSINSYYLSPYSGVNGGIIYLYSIPNLYNQGF